MTTRRSRSSEGELEGKGNRRAREVPGWVLCGLSAASAVLFAVWATWSYSRHARAVGPPAEMGIGFTALLLVHELGHVAAMRGFGMNCSPPTFIPFVGALVSSRDIESRDARVEGVIGICGPIAGTAMSYLVIGLYVMTGHETLIPIALSSLVFNGLNMIPVPPLDGGRALGAVSVWIWIPGLLSLAFVVYLIPSVIGIVLLAVGFLVVAERLPTRRSPYYQIAFASRLGLLATYVATLSAIVGGIALGIWVGPESLHGLS